MPGAWRAGQAACAPSRRLPARCIVRPAGPPAAFLATKRPGAPELQGGFGPGPGGRGRLQASAVRPGRGPVRAAPADGACCQFSPLAGNEISVGSEAQTAPAHARICFSEAHRGRSGRPFPTSHAPRSLRSNALATGSLETPAGAGFAASGHLIQNRAALFVPGLEPFCGS